MPQIHGRCQHACGQPAGQAALHRRPLTALAGAVINLTLMAVAPLQAAPSQAAPVQAAAAPARQAEQAIRATYLCRGRFDAVELTALFFNREPAQVVLLIGETATRLPLQRSASGSRYADDDQSGSPSGSGSEFWIKGDQASWRSGGHPAAAMRCQARPAQSQR